MKTYIFSMLCLLLAIATVNGQTGLSATENYIYSKDCLDSTCIKNSETAQYYDGMGRLRQIINIKGSPLGKDVVQPIVYDASGKNTRTYLPIPQSGSANGSIYAQSSNLVAFPVNDASNFYANEKIFSEKAIESSPLNRVLQQVQMGNEWNSKPVNLAYSTNSTSDKIRYFKTSTTWVNGVSSNTLIDAGFYQAAQLFKNSVKDEDGNEKLTFKNTKNQVVLERRGAAGNFADTYYIYDKYDHLVYILPPLASFEPDISTNETKRANLCYENKYDGKNRIAERRLPGKGWELLVYDKQNRLVAVQDAVLKTKGQWLYSKYDQFGRVAFTGITSGGDRKTEQELADGILNNNVKMTSSVVFNRQGMDVFYDPATSYPHASKWIALLSVNYYDSYPPYSFNPPLPTSILDQSVLTETQSVSTKGNATMKLVKNIEDDNWTKNYAYYDGKNRVIGTYAINHLGGYTKNEILLSFAGEMLKLNTVHLRKQGEVGVTVSERFIYDSQNRLKRHYHKVGNKPEELLAENTYNEISQLVNKKVGSNLQSIDYAYNIRGWLTDINRDQMIIPDLGGKLFSYKIKYNQKDGITNPDSALFSGKDVKPRFNGSIAEIDWRAVESIGSNPSIIPKRYGYAYDNMNRLSAGYYQNPQNPYSRENTESLSYDVNGNITNLYRTSVTENSNTTATVIDNLSYIYVAGNKISSITDNSGNPSGYEGGGGIIDYDLNGNMSKITDKNISRITYNHLDLPNKLEYGTLGILGSQNYLYDSEGVKLQKTVPQFECGIIDCYTTTDITDYLDGFQYQSRVTSNNGGGGIELLSALDNTKYAYEKQAFSIDATEAFDTGLNPPPGNGDPKNPNLKFFPTNEGFYDYQNDLYIYQYKDHLGNTRVSFTRNSVGALQIVDANDYYPFGMNHLRTGNSFLGPSSFKNYKFLGKELQESGFYDLGARFYMPDIARFNAHDPLSEVTLDPYGYAYNNPLYYSDATGLRSDPINGGMEIGGPQGLDGPGEDPKPNELGGANRPYQIPTIDLKVPIRAMASNPASIMPSYCSVCYSGNGMSSGITLPAPVIRNIQSTFIYRGPENGQGGGLVMMDSMWEVLGIVAANMKPENQEAALGLAAIAIITTGGKAAPAIIKAEAGIAKAEVAAEKGLVMNPKDIHFMQSSIKNSTGEFTVLGNAESLKAGTLNPEILRMNVWKDQAGKVWTLDHRRLGAFKLSGLNEAPINWATAKEVKNQMWKMTTKNGGTSVKLKLGDGKNMIIK
ncbi:DUF6443 domain-containing protein [Chryseobacterium indologenes]|uniref:DUF6443 domain-containing protein n=1 Tax=Chryseobacterium indologenes TaxID=253 RepID=UPI003018E9D7